MDPIGLQKFIDRVWDDSIIDELVEYIKIPNKSPLFDADWAQQGYMEDAVKLAEKWCLAQNISGLDLQVVRLNKRTPLIYIDIPGDSEDCILLYGHLDKQPEMEGWREDLGPWKPVLENDKLYGRGGADDGYALFASLTAIMALREQNLSHAHIKIIIECCEESGSYDLPYYIDTLQDKLGKPDLVICLDSGCGNYEQLWLTTSLRGLVGGDLNVQILSEGVHSGDASGIVPSSFRIARQLLSRLENEEDGEIIPAEFHAEIPQVRVDQAKQAARLLKNAVYRKFPLIAGANPTHFEESELVLRRTWRPALSITGAGGLPSLDKAGNVLRPNTILKLSLRIPPSVDANAASAALKELLEKDPPYGAKVSFTADQAASGWHAPPLEPWLEDSVQQASQSFFQQAAAQMGEGGSIPFMGMLGEKFPQSQFVITGVLGPNSNAHGPNEFLHIPTAKRLTACVAKIIFDHYLQKQEK